MIFTEQKIKNEYVYKVEDAFGKMEFRSPDRLDADMLDRCFMAVFDLKDNSMKIVGTIKGTKINYNYLRSNPWKPKKKQSKKSIA